VSLGLGSPASGGLPMCSSPTPVQARWRGSPSRADYASFMIAVGGDRARGLEYRPQVLWPAAAVAEETGRAFRWYVAKRPTDGGFADDFPEPPDDGLRLDIGCIPGCKHDTLLCCDRRHGDCGCVIEHFDGHPWCNWSGSSSAVVRSFAEWLARPADADPGTSVGTGVTVDRVDAPETSVGDAARTVFGRLA
jgi:hypothetical protein